MNPTMTSPRPDEAHVEVAWTPATRERVPGGIAVAALMAAMLGMLTLAVVNVFTAASPDFNKWVHNVGKLWMPGAQGIGPYSGKETGETALFWKLLDALRPGDIVVADSYYCTYWLLAACRARDVHVVMRNHHRRDDAPADARRLVKGQCVATWSRPPRPEWMDEATYAAMPDALEVRLVESVNAQAGQRTERIVIATTPAMTAIVPATMKAGA